MRSLLKSPGFAAYAILSLALGIGANTALFSVFDQLILKRLPVVQPDHLVVFHSEGVNSGGVSKDNYESVFSYPMYTDLSAQLAPFETLFARSGAVVSLAGLGEPQVAQAELVTGTFFDGLGLKPAAGRLFTAADDQIDGAHPVVVLAYGYWREHFGSRADIVGSKLLVNNHPMEVVGVGPQGFDGIVSGNQRDVYLPLHMRSVVDTDSPKLSNRRSLYLNVFGRLRPNITPTQAEAQAAPAYRAILEGELPGITRATDKFKREFVAKKLEFKPGGQGIGVLRKRYETQLTFLLGMVGLILLIACANVANLFTVRAIGRRKEMSIRVSMGATRSSIVRQLLSESLLLSLCGGLLATLLAYWLQAGLAHFVESIHPLLNWHVLVFNFGLALLTALLFGLLPAIQASNPDLGVTLKEEGSSVSATSSQGHLRQILAFTQVALALTLLAAAGLFARTLSNLQSVDLGFRSDHILTFWLSPEINGYTPERTKTFFQDVQSRLEAVPGAQRVATVVALPLTGWNSVSNITIDGYTAAPDESLDTHLNFVSPGYFDVMGIRRITGRDFDPHDTGKSAKVAIVNEAFVRKWLKGLNPVGHHFGFGAGSSTKIEIEIVGLVSDQRTDDMRTPAFEFVFIPAAQALFNAGNNFVIRTAGDENALSNAVRQAVREVDPNVPIRSMNSMETQKAKSIGDDKLNSILTIAFGILATILAALGLYAVLAFTVAQRTKEIGIRMALGATAGNVVKLVLKGMMRIVLAGIAVGLLGAYATGRWAESLLFGLKGFDPVVIGSAAIMLAIVALLAAALPALRASRTDPVSAMRR